MKDQKQIGVLRPGEKETTKIQQPLNGPIILKGPLADFILSLYSPNGLQGTIPGHISPVDLFEMVNQNFHVNKEQLYCVMVDAGFKYENLEGELYWKTFPACQ